jgi:hypothetical protein
MKNSNRTNRKEKLTNKQTNKSPDKKNLLAELEIPISEQ